MIIFTWVTIQVNISTIDWQHTKKQALTILTEMDGGPGPFVVRWPGARAASASVLAVWPFVPSTVGLVCGGAVGAGVCPVVARWWMTVATATVAWRLSVATRMWAGAVAWCRGRSGATSPMRALNASGWVTTGAMTALSTTPASGTGSRGGRTRWSLLVKNQLHPLTEACCLNLHALVSCLHVFLWREDGNHYDLQTRSHYGSVRQSCFQICKQSAWCTLILVRWKTWEKGGDTYTIQKQWNTYPVKAWKYLQSGCILWHNLFAYN